jgi:NAD(P)-dependent dehydrogenase (short-subunit alcohol dehydrogenase family)/acyl dehydratase/predicted lipid carrier protein YhbT
MTEQLRFDGKVAIVTGAGAGLGRSHALAFAARGARVLVNDLGGGAHGDGASTNAADAVVAEIRAAGGEAAANYDSVEHGAAIVQAALDAFGTLDIVVNNAGILRDISFQNMSEQDWDLIYRVHLLGTMRVTQAAWPILREKQYGRIVMTTSAAGLYGNFGQANYSAAKLALVGLAQTLAEEGRARNIHVNAIAPAAASRLLSTVLPQDIMDVLKPEYVSPLVAWLCHERCAETKGVFEVGAGYIGKLRWERSEGVCFDGRRGIAVEDVAARWDRITDFARSTHPATPAESFTEILDGTSKPSLGGNAFIDLDAATADRIEAESSYDERDLSLYALGVGAARDALDPTELPYVYELGDAFQAVPTYAVMPALNTFLDLARDGRTLSGLHYGLDRILHGEQYTELLRPLPPKAKLRHVFRFKTAYDKAPNALVVLAVDTFDDDGDKLAYNEITLFVRGAGGWGGDRGPSADANTPPARAPDAVIEEKTDASQALLYRLSGDWNPMHADPAFAKAFGFDKPILHGLCTYGFVARHVIRAFAGNDGRRFKSIKVRFADSVFPGETLVTRMWKGADGRVVFETRAKERDVVVIRNAAIEFHAEIPQRKAAAVAPAAETAPAVGIVAADTSPLRAAEAFDVIAHYLSEHPELAAQVKTVFQFKVRNPDSDWVLDLKNGAGACRAGTVDKPDCTLEMDEALVETVVTKPLADVQKLYFANKLKIAGNLMASQKLTVLQAIGAEPYARAKAARTGAEPVVAAPSEASASAQLPAPTSADIFAVIAKHCALNPGLGDQLKTLFQFKLTHPDSDWTIDLRAGDGAVTPGIAAKPDVTLELSDADFIAMSTGQADAQKLYFGGKLKLAGNVMASQKLMFLQKIDPKLLQAVLAERTGAPASASAPAAAPMTDAAVAPGRADDILRALATRLHDAGGALSALAGRRVQFDVRQPSAAWQLDAQDRQARLRRERADDADARFELDDADLAALADGAVRAQTLFQQGRLRVDGDLRLAHALDALHGLFAAAAPPPRETAQERSEA